jgi:hypothetical protein
MAIGNFGQNSVKTATKNTVTFELPQLEACQKKFPGRTQELTVSLYESLRVEIVLCFLSNSIHGVLR